MDPLRGDGITSTSRRCLWIKAQAPHAQAAYAADVTIMIHVSTSIFSVHHVFVFHLNGHKFRLWQKKNVVLCVHDADVTSVKFLMPYSLVRQCMSTGTEMVYVEKQARM